MTIPNQLTLLRIILTPVFLFLLFGESPLSKQLAVVVFVVAALTDWYDGVVARKYGYHSKIGRFMDPLADKILTSGAFIGFVVIGIAQPWMVVLIVIRDIFITSLRSYAEFKGIAFFPSVGAKIKTTVQMIVLYYILFAYTAKHTPQIYLNYRNEVDLILHSDLIYLLMLGVTLLTIFTGIAYLFNNRTMIRGLYANRGKSAESG